MPASGIVQLTGEVVAPKEVPNSRNYASGALNLKSIDEFACRRIQFVLYAAEPTYKPTAGLKKWNSYADQPDLSQY